MSKTRLKRLKEILIPFYFELKLKFALHLVSSKSPSLQVLFQMCVLNAVVQIAQSNRLEILW